MSMFDNYEHLSSTYVPNNQEKDLSSDVIFNDRLPKKEYNHNGIFIGYSWNYGDTVIIPYSINKVIKVENDALVYMEQGDAPTSLTVGTFGQKAYNTFDQKCWICTTLDQDIYTWVEQNKFVYPDNGTKEIIIVNTSVSNTASIKFTITNFRKEEIYTTETNGSSSVTISIDSELSKKLIKGLYYANFSILDGDSYRNDESFLLLVKDEYKAFDLDNSSSIASKTIEELIQDAVNNYLDTHEIHVDINIDDEFSTESRNPVENRVITNFVNLVNNRITSILDSISNISTDINAIKSVINNLSIVASTGDYNDLINTPTKLSDFENDTDFIDSTEFIGVTNRLLSIEEKLPIGNSKIANENYVDTEIERNTAIYLGVFNSVDDLPTNDATNNDYAFVPIYSKSITRDPLDEDQKIGFNKYRYIENTNSWLLEYTINSIDFTEEQWATINSALTVDIKNSIEDHINNASIHVTQIDKTNWDAKATIDFVNSSIENIAAYYITKDANGNPFATKAELSSATEFYSGGQLRTPTRNDYTVVLKDESKTISSTGEDPTTRYLYFNGWQYQYTVNNSGLTASQWLAVNSGITTSKVTEIDTKLPLAGNSGNDMTGALYMGNNFIHGVSTPTAAADAANKWYVDNKISNLDATDINALSLDGGDMSGALKMSGHQVYLDNGSFIYAEDEIIKIVAETGEPIEIHDGEITGIQYVSENDSVVNKKYVDDIIADLPIPESTTFIDLTEEFNERAEEFSWEVQSFIGEKIDENFTYPSGTYYVDDGYLHCYIFRYDYTTYIIAISVNGFTYTRSYMYDNETSSWELKIETSTEELCIWFKDNSLMFSEEGQLQYNGESVEIISNKVTTIDETSVDSEYPSAKCLFDELNIKYGVATYRLHTQIINDDTSLMEDKYIGWYSGNAITWYDEDDDYKDSSYLDFSKKANGCWTISSQLTPARRLKVNKSNNGCTFYLDSVTSGVYDDIYLFSDNGNQILTEEDLTNAFENGFSLIFIVGAGTNEYYLVSNTASGNKKNLVCDAKYVGTTLTAVAEIAMSNISAYAIETSIESSLFTYSKRYAEANSLIINQSGTNGSGIIGTSSDAANATNGLAIGNNTITSSVGGLAIGKYNKSTSSTIFTVGNGTSASNRSNAFSVDSNGTITDGYGNTLSDTAEKVNDIWYGDIENTISNYPGGLTFIDGEAIIENVNISQVAGNTLYCRLAKNGEILAEGTVTLLPWMFETGTIYFEDCGIDGFEAGLLSCIDNTLRYSEVEINGEILNDTYYGSIIENYSINPKDMNRLTIKGHDLMVDDNDNLTYDNNEIAMKSYVDSAIQAAIADAIGGAY